MDKMMKKMEQLDPEERDKLREMLTEKNKKGKSTGDSVEWLYKEDRPADEDYLLGRKIDKYVDDEDEKREEQKKDAPGALFSEVVARRADLDMHTKMREDPLYAIRKKEEEMRRRLLENPVKMKQLQKMVSSAKEKNKKKKKKKKKHKKHKNERSSSDSDSEDADIVSQYLAILNKKKKNTEHDLDKMRLALSRDDGDHRKSTKADSNHDNTSRHKDRHKKQRTKSDMDEEQDEEEQEEPRHDGRNKHEHDRGHRSAKAYGLITRGQPPASGSADTGKASAQDRSRSRSPRRSRASPDRKIHRPSKRSRSRSKSPRDSKEDRTTRLKNQPKRKLNKDEMERKRREMLENAAWRDEQRERNVKRYKEEDAREMQKLETEAVATEDFIHPMMMKHASQSSVADRIKRNIHSVQRTRADLDKNFAKR